MAQRTGLWLLAGLLPAAGFAQSSVTLYGVVSTAVRYTSNIDGLHHNLYELVPSGVGSSQWGIKGSEDLGSGTKAVFVLENGFGVDDGKISPSGTFWGRQAYVGMTSERWGSLTLGRQYNSMTNVGWEFNPLDERLGIFWSDPFYVGGDIFFQDYRINNSVVYQRSMGPVSVQLDYGFGEQPGSMSRGSAMGAGVMYKQGALSVGGAYNQIRSAAGGNTVRSYMLGTSYAMGKATFYLGHMARTESGTQSRFTLSFAGLGYQLTPALHVSGGYYRYQQNGNVVTVSQPTPIALGKGNADIVAAVADYALSKRTSLYLEADVTRMRGGAVGRETEYWVGQPTLGVSSSTRVGVMAGIRHSF